MKVNGRHLYPGREISIQGLRGRFRVKYVTQEKFGPVVTCWGAKGFRSFEVSKIRTVHVKSRMRT